MDSHTYLCINLKHYKVKQIRNEINFTMELTEIPEIGFDSWFLGKSVIIVDGSDGQQPYIAADKNSCVPWEKEVKES